MVDEGNRLIQFTYEGIFEEILDQLGQMPLAAVHHPSAEGQEPLSDRLRRSMTALRQPRQPDLHFTPELLRADRGKGREDRACDAACRDLAPSDR